MIVEPETEIILEIVTLPISALLPEILQLYPPFLNFTVSPCILYHKVLLVPTHALVFKLH